ncbi:hypothetical protein [Halomonas sp. G11]|uniref:hypothetical protein n=1 Tax=Halomonas sp. G11 TaxID=1684425 RepID=UPI000801741E|nr:hypothetical protein [Halomonas sp. G11]OBA00417.1 hypothetical protein ADS46_10640 [Halomonas sp. G11]
MLKVLGSLVEWLKASEQTPLRPAFVVWIRRVLLPNRAPDMELPEFHALHELHHILAERIKQWPERWEEKGRQEGQIEAQRTIARNLLTLGVLSTEQIAEATGLSIEVVAQLQTGSKD